MRNTAAIFKDALFRYNSDGGGILSAAIAYYALFSIFPLLLGAVTIASMFMEQGSAQDFMLQLVSPILPQSRELVTRVLEEAESNRKTVGFLAIASLLWTGTELFSAISQVINRAWGIVEKRSLAKKVALRFIVFGGTGILFAFSSGVTALVRLVTITEATIPGFAVLTSSGWELAIALIAGAFDFLVFLFIYKVVPDTRVPWASAAGGSLVATFLFVSGQHVFLFYLGHFARYPSIYGPLADVIILLFWAYLSASILLYGAEFARVIAERNSQKTPV